MFKILTLIIPVFTLLLGSCAFFQRSPTPEEIDMICQDIRMRRQNEGVAQTK